MSYITSNPAYIVVIIFFIPLGYVITKSLEYVMCRTRNNVVRYMIYFSYPFIIIDIVPIIMTPIMSDMLGLVYDPTLESIRCGLVIGMVVAVVEHIVKKRLR